MLVLSFHIVMKEEYKRLVMVSERMLHNIRNPNIVELNFKRMFSNSFKLYGTMLELYFYLKIHSRLPFISKHLIKITIFNLLSNYA